VNPPCWRWAGWASRRAVSGHDVMLEAFPSGRDPAGCSLAELARAAGPETRRSSRTARRYRPRTVARIWPEVERRGLAELFTSIELPLTRVLARMERAGILIDAAELRRLSA